MRQIAIPTFIGTNFTAVNIIKEKAEYNNNDCCIPPEKN